jgi:hypothetical protein
MIQPIAMCTARLWQGLRFAVLFYVLRCYAMLCNVKGYAVPLLQLEPEPELELELEPESELYNHI